MEAGGGGGGGGEEGKQFFDQCDLEQQSTETILEESSVLPYSKTHVCLFFLSNSLKSVQINMEMLFMNMRQYVYISYKTINRLMSHKLRVPKLLGAIFSDLEKWTWYKKALGSRCAIVAHRLRLCRPGCIGRSPCWL